MNLISRMVAAWRRWRKSRRDQAAERNRPPRERRDDSPDFDSEWWDW